MHIFCAGKVKQASEWICGGLPLSVPLGAWNSVCRLLCSRWSLGNLLILGVFSPCQFTLWPSFRVAGLNGRQCPESPALILQTGLLVVPLTNPLFSRASGVDSYVINPMMVIHASHNLFWLNKSPTAPKSPFSPQSETHCLRKHYTPN